MFPLWWRALWQTREFLYCKVLCITPDLALFVNLGGMGRLIHVKISASAIWFLPKWKTVAILVPRARDGQWQLFVETSSIYWRSIIYISSHCCSHFNQVQSVCMVEMVFFYHTCGPPLLPISYVWAHGPLHKVGRGGGGGGGWYTGKFVTCMWYINTWQCDYSWV